MKQLILHIGTEKTGTSSLQNDLYLNRAHLAQHGVGLLSSADMPNNRRIASFARSRPAHEAYDLELCKAGPDWREQLRTLIRAEIQVMPASIHTLLVTSEHLQSRLTLPAEVAKVAEIFEGLFEQIRIVVYLRRQDKLATSLHSTALRVGWTHESPFPAAQTASKGHYYNYANLLSLWAGVFGKENITIRLFEPKRFEGGLLHSDFLHACRLPNVLAGWRVSPQANEALPAATGATLLAFNRALASLGAPRESEPANGLRWQLIRALEAKFSGPALSPSRQQARDFLALFKDTNAHVAREWFNRESLFDDNLDNYPEHPSEPMVPMSAFELMLPLLQQAVTAYKPASNTPQGSPQATAQATSHVTTQLTEVMTALRAIGPGLAAAATVKRTGRALQPQAPALAQRLQDIGHALDVLAKPAGQPAHPS